VPFFEITPVLKVFNEIKFLDLVGSPTFVRFVFQEVLPAILAWFEAPIYKFV
jgi:hypothetical protein